MADKRAKIFGILVVLVAFLVASFSSLAITSPNILDTDASTYIIVVMLMIFVFLVFCAKEDIDFGYNKRNILYSALILIIYVILLSCLRVYLSSAFMSYRIDALLFPLLLLCFVVLVFGISGAKKLLPLIVYAAFASPFLLMPFLNLSNAFANLNANFVYSIIKSTGIAATRVGLVITSRLGASITISSTCVSIGTFIAFILFLIPIAYLYEGKLRSKLYWIASGTALILILNALRMLFIALVWVYYGLGGAINTFHLFAGQLIFYAAIIIMVLISGKYGLQIKKAGKKTAKDIKSFYDVKDRGLFKMAILAVLFAIIVLVLNSGYGRAIRAPAVLFANNDTNRVVLTNLILNSIENSGNSIAILNTSNTVDLFLLGNIHANLSKSVYAITTVTYSAVPYTNLPGYEPVGSSSKYNLKNGITITAQTAYSNNQLFEINYFSIPYNLSGSWLMVTYVLFERVNMSSLPDCSLINYSATGSVNNIETYIYNLVTDSGSRGLMCQSYLIASSE